MMHIFTRYADDHVRVPAMARPRCGSVLIPVDSGVVRSPGGCGDFPRLSDSVSEHGVCAQRCAHPLAQPCTYHSEELFTGFYRTLHI